MPPIIRNARQRVSSSDCVAFLLHFWGKSTDFKLLENAHCV
jgi:hypothetical protein